MSSNPQAHSSITQMPLAEQIKAATGSIRATPGDAKHRVYLAQLLMVTGQWERALEQLQTAAQIDAKTVPMAQTYRELIQAEILREQVFNASKAPLCSNSYLPTATLLLEAIQHRAKGDHVRADELQSRAYRQAPAAPINIDQLSAQWLADADSRLGPSCELFINGGYYWLAFSEIQALELSPPEDLRDLVWIPAKITLHNDEEKLAFLPARYPFSYDFNDRIALAARTEWHELSDNAWAGVGQKMLVSDKYEFALLETRSLRRISTSDVAG